MQRNSFLVSPNGIPLGTIGCVYNITPFKKDNSIVHIIEDKSAEPGKQIVFEKYYYPDAEASLISKRELEVLKWMSRPEIG